MNIKNEQSGGQGGASDIRNILQLWQNTIMNSAPVNHSASKIKFGKYERKTIYSEPQLLFALLNTQISGIYSNDKFTIFQSQEGLLYSTGSDFREVSREELYGIPRELSI
jgi:hypothetical protein